MSIYSYEYDICLKIEHKLRAIYSNNIKIIRYNDLFISKSQIRLYGPYVYEYANSKETEYLTRITLDTRPSC